jgi:hypothetical protein
MKVVEKLRELLGKKSPGKWHIEADVYEHGWLGTIATLLPHGFRSIIFSGNHNFPEIAEANAALVVPAVNALPELLAVVEAAEKLVELRKADQSVGWLQAEIKAEWDLCEALDALRKVEVQ